MKAKSARLHPHLPTAAEIQASPELLMSDHLPCLFRIPLSEKKTQAALKILSANIYQPNLASGFTPFYEDRVQYEARAERLIAAIKRWVDTTQADAVFLQETWFDQKDEVALLRLLGDQWIAVGEADTTAMYLNAAKMTLEGEPVTQDGIRRCEVIVEGKKYTLGCAHLGHENFPPRTEKTIQKFLSSFRNSILVGDFNSRCVPVSTEPQFLVNNVVSANFRDGVGQGADWTDGAFCSLESEQNRVRQIVPQSLSFEGEWIESPQLDWAVLTDFQHQELKQFRPFLHVDQHHIEAKIDDFLTVKELEALLPGERTLVRMAANAINERRLAIRLSPELSEQNTILIERYRNIDGCSVQFVEGGMKPFCVVMIPFDGVREFFQDYQDCFTWTIQDPTVGKRTLPCSYPVELVRLCHSLDQFLPDDGTHLEACRAFRSRIKQIEQSHVLTTQLFSRILLANYYLHYSEYSSEELARVNPQNYERAPEKMMRHTHIQFAINLFLGVCEQLSRPEWVEHLSKSEIGILMSELNCLAKNIALVAKEFGVQMVDLIACHDIAMGNPFEQKFMSDYHRVAGKILENCDHVMQCQKLLEKGLKGHLLAPISNGSVESQGVAKLCIASQGIEAFPQAMSRELTREDLKPDRGSGCIIV